MSPVHREIAGVGKIGDSEDGTMNGNSLLPPPNCGDK